MIDEAGLFSPAGVQKADAALSQLEQQTHWQVIVETTSSLGDQDAAELTRQNFQNERPNGIYILIVPKKKLIETDYSDEARKVFTRANEREMRAKIAAGFRARRFDRGLLDAVGYLQETLHESPGPSNGAADAAADFTELKALLARAERSVAQEEGRDGARRSLEAQLHRMRRIVEHVQTHGGVREGATVAASPGSGVAPFGGKGSGDRDREFARFVTKTAGPLVKAVSVKLEREGRMGVEISDQVKPEDLLDLSKSILGGARKQFPDKPLSITMFDPMGERILTVHFQPGGGVSYDLAKDSPEVGNKPVSGVTPADVRYAEATERKGSQFLHFVNADLERNGRLWVGITRAVEPNDLNALTDSLLKGARSDFPNRSLAITVFDPEGKRIGTKSFDVQTGKTAWRE